MKTRSRGVARRIRMRMRRRRMAGSLQIAISRRREEGNGNQDGGGRYGGVHLESLNGWNWRREKGVGGGRGAGRKGSGEEPLLLHSPSSSVYERGGG